MPLRLCLLIFAVIGLSNAQSNSEKAWILLEDTSVFQCRGVNNQFQISEKDVSIRNSQGRQVHYLEAPGTYVLSFRNIRVQKPLPNLSGQINGVLQVPIGVGNVLNWDFPYNIMPEKNVLTGALHCDKASGPVQDGGKSYCRYCDLCTTTDQVEEILNSKGHKYLPKLGSSGEPDFDRICTQIDAKSYSMQRTISLPNKQELEKQANAQYTGIGGELKKKLNKGKGKLQTELQLMSSDQHPLTRDQVYTQSASCRCCLPGVSDLSCKLNFINHGCNQDACNGEYAQKCIGGNAQKVGCYTVQFNYQVTDKPEEVKAYLQKNGYQDEYNDFGGGSKNTGSSSNPARSGGGGGGQGGSPSSNSNSNSNNGQAASSGQQSQCIKNIKEDRFKHLCEARWQQNFCCGLCEAC